MRLCTFCAVVAAVRTSTIAAPLGVHEVTQPLHFTYWPSPSEVSNSRIPLNTPSSVQRSHSNIPVLESSEHSEALPPISLAPPSNKNPSQSPLPQPLESRLYQAAQKPRDNNEDPPGSFSSSDLLVRQPPESTSNKKSQKSWRVTRRLKKLFLKIWAQIMKKIQKWYDVSSKGMKLKPGQKFRNNRQAPVPAQDHIQPHTFPTSIVPSIQLKAPEPEGKPSVTPIADDLLPKRVVPFRTPWLQHVTMGALPKFLHLWLTRKTFRAPRIGLFNSISYLYRFLFNREKTPPAKPPSSTSSSSRKVAISSSTEPFLSNSPPNLVTDHNLNKNKVSVRKKLDKEANFIPSTTEGELVATALDLLNTQEVATAIRDSLMDSGLYLKAIGVLTKVSTIEIFIGHLSGRLGAIAEEQLRRLEIGPCALQFVNEIIKKLASNAG